MRTLRALHGEGVADARLEALLDSATAWAFAWTAAGAAGDTAAAAASDAAAPASLAALLPRRPRGRRLVGLARCWGDRALVALLDDVFVEPEHRRAGVGRRLVQLLLAELRVRGIADIGVLCPASAAPFFASCAFAEDAASRLCVAAGGAGAGGEATRLVASQR